jgi:hypothetical protein
MAAMTPIAWMSGVCVAAWLAATALFGGAAGTDVLLGMLGPLAIACVTWVLMERTYRRNPQQLTAVMIAAFGGKLVFFGAYVVVMIRAVGVDPVPFVSSFTGYFIGLYVIEALYLKRLFAGERRT